MEAKLETIPTVKPDVHFELNDISQKIIQVEPLSQKEFDSLEMIYMELQDLEKELVTSLDVYRSKKVISKEEFLLAINYFLIACQQGPHSEQLNLMFRDSVFDTYKFDEVSKTISIPEHMRTLLQTVYLKIAINQSAIL